MTKLPVISLGAAAVLLLAACGTAGHQAAGPEATGRPAAEHLAAGSAGAAVPGAAARAEHASTTPLRDAVLAAGDAPPATAYLAKQSGPLALTDLVHGDTDAAKEQQQLQSAGFKAAFRSLFAGLPGGAQASERSVATIALVFPTPAAASSAAGILDASTRESGTRLAVLPSPKLGDDGGTAYRASQAGTAGYSYYYRWRQGTVVRAVIDIGVGSAPSPTYAVDLAHRLLSATPGHPLQAADAPALALAPQVPTGTTLDATRSGPKTAASLGLKPAAAAALRQLGLQAGYGNIYVSAGLKHPAKPAGATTGQGNLISSEAQQYTDPAAAADAYHLFVGREQKLFNGHPVTVLPTSGLGAEAFGFNYTDHRSGGDVGGIGYFWRHGNLVLSLFQVGVPSFVKLDTASGLAHTVDQRIS